MGRGAVHMVVFVAGCRPWLVLGGPFPSFTQTGLEKHTSSGTIASLGRHSVVKSPDYNEVC